MTYRAPVRDLAFTLEAVAGVDQLAITGAFPDFDAEVMNAVLEAAGGTVLTPEGEPVLYGKATEGFRNGFFVARGG